MESFIQYNPTVFQMIIKINGKSIPKNDIAVSLDKSIKRD